MQSVLEVTQSLLPSEETCTEYNIKTSQPDQQIFKWEHIFLGQKHSNAEDDQKEVWMLHLRFQHNCTK